MGTKVQITAESARQTSKAPERLLNSILRNIKEEAEIGSNTFIAHYNDLNPDAVIYVSQQLRNLGFEVEVSAQSDSCRISETQEIEQRNTVFVIKW